MNYEKVIEAIEHRGIMPKKGPSLEPMKEALGLLLPKTNFQAIVVGGTNGKGTVCATLESLLIDAKKTVGLYTSPHLEETTERIRLQGMALDRMQFCEIYQKVEEKLRTFEKKQPLSHFEILTLMAAWAFHTENVDYAIFEVGLGGTWDATNALAHRICAITSISYDHENLLGSSLVSIASHKFGIVTTQATVVHTPFPESIQALAHEVQTQTQSTWKVSQPFTLKVDTSQQEPQFLIQTPWGQATLACPGKRAAENTALALTLFETLGYAPNRHLQAISKMNWPGRMQKVLKTPCPVYFSGDHNPSGVQSLLDLLPYYRRKKLLLLIGIGQHKNQDAMLSLFFSLPDTQIVLTETPFGRRPLKDYGHWLQKAHYAHEDPYQAFQYLLAEAKETDLLVVTGSLYLIGYLSKKLKTCTDKL
jgi:dihydrofolate synthase/folylpolyglutamate synthase